MYKKKPSRPALVGAPRAFVYYVSVTKPFIRAESFFLASSKRDRARAGGGRLWPIVLTARVVLALVFGELSFLFQTFA